MSTIYNEHITVGNMSKITCDIKDDMTALMQHNSY